MAPTRRSTRTTKVSISNTKTGKIIKSKKKPVSKSVSNDQIAKNKKLCIMDLSLLKSGKLLVAGSGEMGQVGLGVDVLHRKRPAVVKTLQKKNFCLICAGGIHTCCYSEDNELYTFGCNDESALGRSTAEEDSEFIPALVGGPLLRKKICQISAGDSHTAVLTIEGQVYLWGNFRDGHGSMGLLQPNKATSEPQQIATMSKVVVQIASGSDHLIMLTEDGLVFSCGNAEQGQLGRIGSLFCDRYRVRGSRAGSIYIPQQVYLRKIKGQRSRNIFITKIFSGAYTSWAISNEGEVFGWGLNNYNQLGIPDKVNRFHATHIPHLSKRGIQYIAAGDHHAIFLTDEGKVYALGRGCDGRLGLGPDVKYIDEMTLIKDLKDIASISAQNSASYAIDKEGTAYGWGIGLMDGIHHDINACDEPKDQWTPTKLVGENLKSSKVLHISCGAQHCVLVVSNEQETE